MRAIWTSCGSLSIRSELPCGNIITLYRELSGESVSEAMDDVMEQIQEITLRDLEGDEEKIEINISISLRGLK